MRHAAPPNDPTAEETHIDPVCGKSVRFNSVHRAVHDEQVYVFCCASCRDRFALDPLRYMTPPG